MKVAFLFPGQGAQEPGMLHALPDHPAVAATLAEASAVLGERLLDLDSEPALAGNRAVTMRNTNNLVQVVLNGGFAPATYGNPLPYGMPPFMLQLNDEEIAQVLSHIRSAWGNQASGVSEFDISRLRRAQSH